MTAQASGTGPIQVHLLNTRPKVLQVVSLVFGLQ